jgi:hypothetical protein
MLHNCLGCLYPIYITQQRRSDLCIPRNETARPRSQYLHSCIFERSIYSHDRVCLFCKLRGLVPNFHVHVSVSDLYIPTNGPPILLGRPITGIYINRSQIHVCRNWERGHAVSSLEIFISNFRHSVVAVRHEVLKHDTLNLL